ncbi:MAG: ABC transporter permease [bacterium]|nr:ABC transporter permease [bacterium]MCP5065413.1 ABC transporter permease [bacterium]
MSEGQFLRSRAVSRQRRTLHLLPVLLEDAVLELHASWRRHLLTFVGLVWGSASVVLLLGVGTGFMAFLDLGIDKTGSRWATVEGEYTTAENAGLRPGRPVQLETEDVLRIRAASPRVALAAGEILLTTTAETRFKTRAAVVSAADSELAAIQNHELARGRYFDSRDVAEARPVAVLGAALARALFPKGQALGEPVRISGRGFIVVGILEEKGFQFITNRDLHDNMAFIPLSSGQRVFARGDEVDHVYIEPLRIAESAQLERDIRHALGPRHRLVAGDEEALHMDSVPEMIGGIRNVFVALELLLGVVGTLTLALSGVGVANLMVALVNGRQRELAMRRACGARRSDLLLQIVAETLVIVVGGGLTGIVLAIGICFAISVLPLPASVPDPVISPTVLVTTAFILSWVGVGAAIGPARLAGRVDPSAALRSS